MTTAINLSACSSEFRTAFMAVQLGHPATRSSWPEGQFIQLRSDGRIAVFRDSKMSSPFWMGPSSEESDASDWYLLPNSSTSPSTN
jgi:hypothetical protein